MQDKNRNPVEFTGKALDKRNDLTGPNEKGERPFPKRPDHVQILDKDANFPE